MNTQKPDSPDKIAFLLELEQIIRQRVTAASSESYTAKLVASGKQRIAQKLGEEALEVALASVAGSREDQINESADLVYHLLVLLHCNEQCLADVAEVLRQRHTKT